MRVSAGCVCLEVCVSPCISPHYSQITFATCGTASIRAQSAVHTLLNCSIKALKNLLSTSEGLEAEAMGLRAIMVRDQRASSESSHRDLQELRGRHRVVLATLTRELHVAEVEDKIMCDNVQGMLLEIVQEERGATAREAKAAAAAAVDHADERSRLEAAMRGEREALGWELRDAERSLQLMTRSRDQAVEEGRVQVALLKQQVAHVEWEHQSTEAALREEQDEKHAYSERARARIHELVESQEAAESQAAKLELKLEQEGREKTTSQAMMAGKLARLRKLQELALGVKPNESDLVPPSPSRTRTQLRNVVSAARAQHGRPVQHGGRSSAGRSRSTPSFNAHSQQDPTAVRSRGLLYSEVTKARLG